MLLSFAGISQLNMHRCAHSRTVFIFLLAVIEESPGNKCRYAFPEMMHHNMPPLLTIRSALLQSDSASLTNAKQLWEIVYPGPAGGPALGVF